MPLYFTLLLDCLAMRMRLLYISAVTSGQLPGHSFVSPGGCSFVYQQSVIQLSDMYEQLAVHRSDM